MTVVVGGQSATDDAVFWSVVHTRKGVDVQTAFAAARAIVQQVLARL